MTESMPKYPKPTGDEREALYDAKWDLIDNGMTTLHPGDDDKWMYWLTRYEGFAPGEIAIHRSDNAALIIETAINIVNPDFYAR